jgi:hypothetical protein
MQSKIIVHYPTDNLIMNFEIIISCSKLYVCLFWLLTFDIVDTSTVKANSFTKRMRTYKLGLELGILNCWFGVLGTNTDSLYLYLYASCALEEHENTYKPLSNICSRTKKPCHHTDHPTIYKYYSGHCRGTFRQGTFSKGNISRELFPGSSFEGTLSRELFGGNFFRGTSSQGTITGYGSM